MNRTPIVILLVVLVVIAAFVVFKESAVAPVEISPSPSQTPAPQANIIILSPKTGDMVSNPIRVIGKARVFEATFAYRLKDANGKILYAGNGMTTGPSVPDYGNFDFKVAVPSGATPNLKVEVFEFSAKDGSVINLASVPVRLSTTETSKVKVFFSNNKLDPAVTCTKVFPVERSIIKTQEVGFVAIAELLRGVLSGENGYASSIPEGTILKSLNIRNGTAYAEFNYILEQGSAGLCQGQFIRAQIEQTLKQFPSVKNVVISIDGRTQDILQP